MEVIWNKPPNRPLTFNVPYTIGDIVKVIKKGQCVSNGCIKQYFGLKDCLLLKEDDTSFKGLGFPDLTNNNDEWKIIDIRSPYGVGLLVLLRNRFNVYLCMADTTSIIDPTFSIVRKAKKRLDVLELNY